jgi:hypothetical protein
MLIPPICLFLLPNALLDYEKTVLRISVLSLY